MLIIVLSEMHRNVYTRKQDFMTDKKLVCYLNEELVISHIIDDSKSCLSWFDKVFKKSLLNTGYQKRESSYQTRANDLWKMNLNCFWILPEKWLSAVCVERDLCSTVRLPVWKFTELQDFSLVLAWDFILLWRSWILGSIYLSG